MAKFKITIVHEVEAVSVFEACKRVARFNQDPAYRAVEELKAEKPSLGAPEVRRIGVDIETIGDGPG